MLIARPAPRKERSTALKMAMTFYVFDGDQKIGQVVLGMTDQRGLMTLRDQSYVIGRADAGSSGGVFHALVELAKGHTPVGASPNPFVLRDATGTVVAVAEPIRNGFTLSHDGRGYRFKRTGYFKSSWNLYPPDGDQTLGRVAPQGLFSASADLDLPAGLAEAFRVFLFWLRLNSEMQSAMQAAP